MTGPILIVAIDHNGHDIDCGLVPDRVTAKREAALLIADGVEAVQLREATTDQLIRTIRRAD